MSDDFSAWDDEEAHPDPPKQKNQPNSWTVPPNWEPHCDIYFPDTPKHSWNLNHNDIWFLKSLKIKPEA